MGNDPKKTRNKNSNTSPVPAPPLLSPEYTSDIRHRPPAVPTQSTTPVCDYIQQCRSDEDAGYLRIIPTEDYLVWYIKWKWTAGRWANHYVMYVVADGNLSAGLRGIAHKVAAVRSGATAPVKDKYLG